MQCVANEKPAYVTIKIGSKKVAETTHEHDRIWNQTFQILCAHPSDTIITIALKTRCSTLGKIKILANQLLDGASLINGFFPLCGENGKPNLKLKLQYILWFKPAEYESSWEKVLANDAYHGLKNATFPQRSNCNVILYQDAHHCASFQPPSALSQTPKKLWEDVYKAIEGAKHLVYIAGWSLNPKIILVS